MELVKTSVSRSLYFETLELDITKVYKLEDKDGNARHIKVIYQVTRNWQGKTLEETASELKQMERLARQVEGETITKIQNILEQAEEFLKKLDIADDIHFVKLVERQVIKEINLRKERDGRKAYIIILGGGDD